MVKWIKTTIGVLLVVVIFLAWAEGRGPSEDFAGSVGRVTGDVVSAIIEFFEGLADNKPSTGDE
jgi:hypothetical protein